MGVQEEISADQEKCTKQYVQIVNKKQKCHSNQLKENQYIVEIASKKEDNKPQILY